MKHNSDFVHDREVPLHGLKRAAIIAAPAIDLDLAILIGVALSILIIVPRAAACSGLSRIRC